MTEYDYTAKAADGSRAPQTGTVYAYNEQEAQQKVKAMFSYPVNVEVGQKWHRSTVEVTSTNNSADAKK